MTRFIAPLALALLAGCSCCDDAYQAHEFTIDDALLSRLTAGVPGTTFDARCRDVCGLLAGQTDAGAADATLPDTGPSAPPPAPPLSCFFPDASNPRLLRCEYSFVCAR